MLFHETEGPTIITTLESARDHGLAEGRLPSAMITCTVHSALEGVGFMAKLSRVLGAGDPVQCRRRVLSRSSVRPRG